MTTNKITLEQVDRRNQVNLSGLRKSANELQAVESKVEEEIGINEFLVSHRAV